MITYERAINRLAERVTDRTQESRNIRLQRRNQVVDIYGMEFTRQGDVEKPASFYVSISPDLIYFERFEFKVIIESFRVPIAEPRNGDISGNEEISPTTVRIRASNVDLTVEPTNLTTNLTTLSLTDAELSIDDGEEVTPNPHNHTLTPNPHSHTIANHTHTIDQNSHNHEAEPHTHRLNLRGGMTFQDVTAEEFSIWMWIEFCEDIELVSRLTERVEKAGRSYIRVNMTPYFKAILPDDSRLNWIDGTGVFPAAGLRNFDVLEAVAYMEPELREKILKPGYKQIDIEGDGIFNATLVNYLKYSHVNR